MNQKIQAHFQNVLSHLYINPLEKCNLKCKICYTKKTDPQLSNTQILKFIANYQQVKPVKIITFCGGEVFALQNFPELVNQITNQCIFVQIITNGTIDRLAEFSTPNSVNLIISLDGLEAYHDSNRGEGTFQTSLQFMKKAKDLGFHLDVFSIVTKQNLPYINDFETDLQKKLGVLPNITYHPRKPPTYLTTHPISNIIGETEGFDFLTPSQMTKLMRTKNVFPPANLGCYQISLMSDGKVFGCCEGTVPLGSITDQSSDLIQALTKRLETWSRTNSNLPNCLGCSQPDFVCGIKEYLHL